MARFVQLDWARVQATPREMHETRIALVADETQELDLDAAEQLRALLSGVQRGLDGAFTENRILEPARVARIATMLDAVAWDAVAIHFRPEVMELLGFPGSDPADLREDYELLRAFYRDARTRGNAIYCNSVD